MNVPEGFEPTKWWRVTAPDGSLWCETSIEREARECMRPGDTIWRLYSKTEYLLVDMNGDES